MFNWKTLLSESPVEWLLEQENASVRYFALREILDKGENDSEVIAAKRSIVDSAIVKRILNKQKPEGYWEEPSNPYHPKYRSSYWSIMSLGQLGMDKTDPRVERACEYILRFQLAEGGFSSFTRELGLREYELQRRKGKPLPAPGEYASSIVHEHEYSCLTGNMAAALIRIGYTEDPRIKKAFDWLIRVQNRDGGWLCPYWKAHVKDKHGCFFGTVCPLEAFSLADKRFLTTEMKSAVEKGAEFMLVHRLFKADHHGYAVINHNWLTLSFPMFTSYNILRGLDVLTSLGYAKDKRLGEAVEVLLHKRRKDGKWILESSPEGRMQANFEAKGRPSKWVTLVALRILKRLA